MNRVAILFVVASAAWSADEFRVPPKISQAVMTQLSAKGRHRDLFIKYIENRSLDLPVKGASLDFLKSLNYSENEGKAILFEIIIRTLKTNHEVMPSDWDKTLVDSIVASMDHAQEELWQNNLAYRLEFCVGVSVGKSEKQWSRVESKPRKAGDETIWAHWFRPDPFEVVVNQPWFTLKGVAANSFYWTPGLFEPLPKKGKSWLDSMTDKIPAKLQRFYLGTVFPGPSLIVQTGTRLSVKFRVSHPTGVHFVFLIPLDQAANQNETPYFAWATGRKVSGATFPMATNIERHTTPDWDGMYGISADFSPDPGDYLAVLAHQDTPTNPEKVFYVRVGAHTPSMGSVPPKGW